MWRPSVAQACPKASTSKAKESSDIEDLSSGSSNEDGSPTPRYSLRIPPSSQRYLLRSEDEVEDDVITISGKQLICTSRLTIQVYSLHFRWRSNRGNQHCHSGHSSLCQCHQGYLQFFDEFWWYGKPLDFLRLLYRACYIDTLSPPKDGLTLTVILHTTIAFPLCYIPYSQNT